MMCGKKPSTARRQAKVAARPAAAPLSSATASAATASAATASALIASVLCAVANYWTTLLQVYPAGTGATTIAGLVMASAALFTVATVAAVATVAVGAGAWAARLAAAPFPAALAAVAAASALLTTLWAVTGDPALQAPVEVVVALTALAVTAVLTGRLPPVRGWDLRRFGLVELQMLVAIGMAATLLLGLLARPWETVSLIGADTLPTWYLTTVLLTIGACAGQFALQLLRRPGAGIMALMVAFGFHALLIAALQRPIGGFEGTASAYLLALAPAGIMDLIYFFNMHRADDRRVFWQALISAVTTTLLSAAVLLSRLVQYPPVTDATIPGMMVTGALAGLAAGWAGMVAGRWINWQARS